MSNNKMMIGLVLTNYLLYFLHAFGIPVLSHIYTLYNDGRIRTAVLCLCDFLKE